MKRTISAVVFAVSAAVPSFASAQELGAKGDAVFSADRLFGITGTHLHDPGVNQNGHDDWTSISFGWRGTGNDSPFDVPRFSFDYLVINHLSLGGSLGYSSLNADVRNDYSMFLFAARIGYLYSFGRVVGIWPRGGITYHTDNINGDRDIDGLALTLECPFTFSPASHFAFTVGPTFDADLFGNRQVAGNPNNIDHTYRTFGVSAGLLGWF
jgi:hypothetical protein